MHIGECHLLLPAAVRDCVYLDGDEKMRDDFLFFADLLTPVELNLSYTYHCSRGIYISMCNMCIHVEKPWAMAFNGHVAKMEK